MTNIPNEDIHIITNGQGIWMVEIGNRLMRDEDLLIAISSNHKSKILEFQTESEAHEAIIKYKQQIEMFQMFSKKKLYE
jgi:nitrous oxide reductase